MSSGGVMLSGWLRKSPPERKLRRNAWKKRWFVLRSGRLSGDSNVLEYFRHQGSKKPIRAISLNECIQIDANVPIKYEKKDPSQQFVFDIVTKTRIYYLVAESSLEMASWVRYLCDLCGFNHDTPENQADLGSQQQTFKPDQTVAQRDNHNHNGSLSPSQDGIGSAEEDGVPVPLPRPKKTMSVRSVLINKGNSSAESSVPYRENNGVLREELRTSSGSGHVSAAGTPQVARKLVSGKDGYSYAVNPLLSDDSGSDYVLLADCKTAVSEETNLLDQSAHSAKLDERRQSTDSVFTHESRVDDVMTDNDDVIISQPQKHPMRYITGRRNQRLDSMPDCPPPLPPGIQPDNNYSNLMQQYSDDDEVSEARTRSRTSQGLCPIDDRDLKKVPLNLQREHHVDDMGDSAWNNSLISSPSFTTEYINTSDVSAELGFPVKSNHHQYSSSQSQSIASSTSQKGTSQFPVFTDRENVAYNQQRRVSTQMTPQRQFQHNSIPQSPPSASMYSSAHTLNKTPTYNSPGPSRAFTNVLMPMQKMRRSSSVGQLEVVANELAAKTEYKVHYPRRRSIDYNAANAMGYNRNNTGANTSAHFGSNLSIPPPRPPKSESAKQTMLNARQECPNASERFAANVSPPQTNYRPDFEPPDSPPHSMVIGVIGNRDQVNTASPEHSTITHTIPSSEVKRIALPSDSRSVSLSSTGSGSTSASGSSRSRSPAGTYEVSSGKIQSSSKLQTNKADSNNNQQRGLSGINDQLPTYEQMLNQSEMDIPEKPDKSFYTCMAGATTLINKPAFPYASKMSGTLLNYNEPPPIQRDLKPGPRKSLDSDGSSETGQRPHYPKSSIDEADGMHISNQLLMEQISSHPHTMGHYSTSPNVGSPWMTGYSDTLPQRRLQPPERPPKHSQSSLSPRTPPSVTLPPRSNPYGMHKTVQKMPGAFIPGLQQKSPASLVPDRPPKPESLKSGSSSSLLRERPSPAVISTASDFTNSPHFFRKSPVVPPPAQNLEQELKYIELLDLHHSDHIKSTERNEPAVDYVVIDRNKTQALEKITKTRNQEPSSHKRFDSKANKSGK